ncbi:Ubiquitin carboxyl-terminal hydrolase 48, partial [Gonapodya sp. JEL0774]
MRFVFDLKAGTKKKVKATVKFPELLDMRQFLDHDVEEDDTLYELAAVLLHRGSSAYSGHYIAHIFDHGQSKWFQLDDETVTELKETAFDIEDISPEGSKKKSIFAPKIDVADPDEFDGPVTPIKSRSESYTSGDSSSKRVHSSRNAYALTYIRRSERKRWEDTLVQVDLPEEVGLIVTDSNKAFESELRKWEDRHLELVREFEAKRALRMSVCEVWHVTDDSEFSLYVPTDWIKRWLGDPFKPIQFQVDGPPELKRSNGEKPDHMHIDTPTVSDDPLQSSGSPASSSLPECGEEVAVRLREDYKIDRDFKKGNSASMNGDVNGDGHSFDYRERIDHEETASSIPTSSEGQPPATTKTEPRPSATDRDNKLIDCAALQCQHRNLALLKIDVAKRISI